MIFSHNTKKIIKGYYEIIEKRKKDIIEMLLEFQVENYLSFREKATLNMIASSSATSKKESLDSVINIGKYKILSSAALYGANASGKSNFLAAIHFMRDFILVSAHQTQIDKKIKNSHFKFNSACDNQPSTFEMVFLVRGVEYENISQDVVFRYGFQVDRSKVCAEWLFGRFTTQESRLFSRVGDEIIIGDKFIEGKKVYKATGKIAKTTLFLSLIDYIKGENTLITSKIIDWVSKVVNLSPIADSRYSGITSDIMSNKDMKKQIIQAFCLADICIEDFKVEKELIDLETLPIDIKSDIEKHGSQPIHKISVKSFHKKYNKDKEEIGIEQLDFDKEESAGSQKFFAIIGPILDALKIGLVIVIDEIDARLHPKLCELLIRLFNSKKTNINNAQLIFATHNTLIMHRRMLRRDQIYFVEKDKHGESELYSLLDYKKVRSDASYDKDYLLGKYGAIPFLGDFESFLVGDK